MVDELSVVFLRHSAAKLAQMREHIHLCLNYLDDAKIWSRGSSNENAVGNLILHLCGNARQWVLSGVGGQPDIRRRDEEFSADSAIPVNELRRLLDTTIEETIAVIDHLPAGRLLDQVSPQNVRVTVLEAIYQVVGHFQQHTGQIIFAVKALTGADLAIYKPPQTPAAPIE